MSTKDQNDLKFELELVFRSDAADILAAREKARMMHHGHDIRAAGDEGLIHTLVTPGAR